MFRGLTTIQVFELRNLTMSQSSSQSSTRPNCVAECSSPRQRRSRSATYSPRLDIVEQSDAYLVLAELPGVSAEDLDLQFENGQLTIQGKVTPRQKDTKYLLREYGVGSFERTLSLDETVDAEKIEASLEEGVLTVTLPKEPAVRPKKIPINNN